MEQAAFSPYPYLSWLGTWKATGRSESDIEFGMQQVAYALIYTARGKADVIWKHGGREDRFRVDSGTVRFCPADDDYHTLIGQRCEPGHRFYTLLIPRGHLVQLADAEGIAVIPELRHSVSARDAVLTSCMRTLSNVHQHLDEASLERRESAALSLILRLLSKNEWKGPDWKNDNSVFHRRTLDGLVAYIDYHLQAAPSLARGSNAPPEQKSDWTSTITRAVFTVGLLKGSLGVAVAVVPGDDSAGVVSEFRKVPP